MPIASHGLVCVMLLASHSVLWTAAIRCTVRTEILYFSAYHLAGFARLVLKGSDMITVHSLCPVMRGQLRHPNACQRGALATC